VVSIHSGFIPYYPSPVFSGAVDVLNVKAMGARGDGITDDSLAIQDCLDVVSADHGGVVYFPSGTYLINHPLTVTVSNTVICGDGWLSQIRFDGTVVPAAISLPDANPRKVDIRDLRISQINPAGAGTAIDASNFQNSALERLLIDAGLNGKAPNIGISFNSAITHYNVIEDSRINCDGANAIGVRFSGGANSNVLRNCRILPSVTDASQTGILVDAYAIELDHPDIENAAGTAISLTANATSNRPTVITAPYLEANGTNIAIAAGAAFPAMGSSRNTIVKAAATAIANSAVLAADPHLTSSVLSGRTYRVKLFLIMDGPTNNLANFGMAFDAPVGSSMTWAVTGLVTSVNGATTGSVSMTAATAAGTQRNVGLAGVGTPTVAIVEGVLTVGAASGTFDLKWAQGIANATAVTLYAGSTMTLEQVA